MKDDVRQVEAVWCLDIVGKGEGRTVKNRTSIRKVPIRLSILTDFLTLHREQAGPRLFPRLYPYGATKISQWFSFGLEDLKIKRPELTLHSLRHRFAVGLERARVHPSIAYMLMGHALPGGVHATTYLKSLKYSMSELSEGVEAVRMPKI